MAIYQSEANKRKRRGEDISGLTVLPDPGTDPSRAKFQGTTTFKKQGQDVTYSPAVENAIVGARGGKPFGNTALTEQEKQQVKDFLANENKPAISPGQSAAISALSTGGATTSPGSSVQEPQSASQTANVPLTQSMVPQTEQNVASSEIPLTQEAQNQENLNAAYRVIGAAFSGQTASQEDKDRLISSFSRGLAVTAAVAAGVASFGGVAAASIGAVAGGGAVGILTSKDRQETKENYKKFTSAKTRMGDIINYVNAGVMSPDEAVIAWNRELNNIEIAEAQLKLQSFDRLSKGLSGSGDENEAIASFKPYIPELTRKLQIAIATPNPNAPAVILNTGELNG